MCQSEIEVQHHNTHTHSSVHILFLIKKNTKTSNRPSRQAFHNDLLWKSINESNAFSIFVDRIVHSKKKSEFSKNDFNKVISVPCVVDRVIIIHTYDDYVHTLMIIIIDYDEDHDDDEIEYGKKVCMCAH